MNTVWMSVGSIVLGVVALLLPLAGLLRGSKHVTTLTGLSLTACATAIWLQVLYTNHLVEIGDWSALMDTHPAITGAATILLVVVAALNVIFFIVAGIRGQMARSAEKKAAAAEKAADIAAAEQAAAEKAAAQMAETMSAQAVEQPAAQQGKPE